MVMWCHLPITADVVLWLSGTIHHLFSPNHTHPDPSSLSTSHTNYSHKNLYNPRTDTPNIMSSPPPAASLLVSSNILKRGSRNSTRRNPTAILSPHRKSEQPILHLPILPKPILPRRATRKNSQPSLVPARV